MAVPKTLRSVPPNLGVEQCYKRRLLKLIDDMHCSLIYWLKCSYKNNAPMMADDRAIDQRPSVPPPNLDPLDQVDLLSHSAALSRPTSGETLSSAFLGVERRLHTEDEAVVITGDLIDHGLPMSFDALPANQLKVTITKLSKRWMKRFNKSAKSVSQSFADSALRHNNANMKNALKTSGIPQVKLKLTPAMRDVLRATVEQNVSLIKSIPAEHLTKVTGIIMRGIQHGSDLGTITKQLEKTYKITRSRAALIARDQNNKANGAMHRVRQVELGITEAIWLHSHASREPRPTHLKMDGKRYNINKGMFDPAVGERIYPGQLINCRCLSRSIIPGL